MERNVSKKFLIVFKYLLENKIIFSYILIGKL